MKTTKQILIEARALLTPATWIQGELDTGMQFCSIGAIERAAGMDISYPTVVALQLAIKPKTKQGFANAVGAWNDEPGRTLEEVHEAFDKAIEKTND